MSTDFTISEEDRKALQSKQLYLLCEFINVCTKNNLMYYLVGGSALGAVRHKGFIPWDDDIDVALPRPEYNRFISLALEQLPKDIFLQTFVTDKDYRNDYAKLRLEGTTFIESSCRNLNINHGIYMDIFPIDGYPSGKIKRGILNSYKRLVHYYVAKDYVILIDQSPVRKVYGKCRSFMCSLMCGFQSTSKILESLEKFYQKWDYYQCEEVICHGGVWGNLEHCEKAQYGNGTIAYFENIPVMIPELYDQYLEHKYPNYMCLPPEEKRIPHHYCDMIDVNNSYKLYRSQKNG